MAGVKKAEGDPCDRKPEDVFAIQDKISLAIEDNLKIKLLGEERSAVLKRYTEDFEIHTLYLKAINML